MKHELKHIGPIVERCILDSWRINDYLVALKYTIMGGLAVCIFKEHETVRFFPTDATYNVALFYLNNCMWACDTNSVLRLPEKHFSLKTSEFDKISNDKDCKLISKGKNGEPTIDYQALEEKRGLFCSSKRWEKHKEQFQIQNFQYIDNINDELVSKSLKEIRPVSMAQLDDFLKKETKGE